jgi:hypothetical protein
MRSTLACALLAAWAVGAVAAEPYPDQLIVGKRTESLAASPLKPALEADAGLAARLKKYTDASRCKAPERGYVATWQVQDNRLVLARLEVDACDKPRRVPISLLFPGRPIPLEASWYTGELRFGTQLEILFVKAGTVTGSMNVERSRK